MWPFRRCKKKWDSFISYSHRESEVRAIKPFADAYVQALQARGVTTFPYWYDGAEIGSGRNVSKAELAAKIRCGLENSRFTSAFLSPGYYESCWCNFEWDNSDERLPITWKQPPDPPPKFSRYVWIDITERLDTAALELCADAAMNLRAELRSR